AKGKKYFGDYWKGFESDPILLEEYSQWIILFRKYLEEDILTGRSFKLIGAGIDNAALESAVSKVLTAKQEFLESLKKLGAHIGADFGKMFGNGLEAIKLSALKTRVTRWKNETSSLIFWSQ